MQLIVRGLEICHGILSVSVKHETALDDKSVFCFKGSVRKCNTSMKLLSFYRSIVIYTVLLGVINAQAETLDANLKTLQSVGKEGLGNSAATVAWQEVASVDAELIPTILSSIDGDNPLSANWIRAAVDAIASRHEKLPLNDLEVFLADVRHDPRARRLAWELIQDRESERAEEIIRGMLDDPSVELRYDAVDRLIREADREKGSPAATELLRQALGAARDVNQVKKITSDLQEIGDEIDLQQHFGFLSNWYVVGPFDNSGGQGFAKIYPPEKSVDIQATYDGKDGPVSWHQFLTADPYGMVDINKAIPGPGDGLKEVVAYAFTTITFSTEQVAEVRLGCKNAWKIWVNGSLLFERDEYHRGMRIDQYRLPVKLNKGSNTLLVKLCQDGQTKDWTKQWQFQLRLCDATGTAILAVDRRPTPLQKEAEATHGGLHAQ